MNEDSRAETGCQFVLIEVVVPRARLELARFYPLDPKSSASTNFATSALTADGLGREGRC